MTGTTEGNRGVLDNKEGAMNVKRWMMAGIGAWAVIFGLDFLVHHKLLSGLYEETMAVWRPKGEGGSLMALMFLGQFLFALALAWFYTKGYEEGKPGLAQGLRFGFYAGVFLAAAKNFIWYVVLPIPFVLNLAWLGSAFIDCLAAGAVVGLIYRRA